MKSNDDLLSHLPTYLHSQEDPGRLNYLSMLVDGSKGHHTISKNADFVPIMKAKQFFP